MRDDLSPQDKPLPKVPVTGDATIGDEANSGLSGGDNTMTGGQDGAGSSKSAKTVGYDFKQATIDRQNKLIEKVVEAQNNINKKKVNGPVPTSETSGIPKTKGSGGSAIGGEEKFTADEVDRTDRGNKSMIGAEQDAIGDKPQSPKDHPSIATGDALMGNEGDELQSQKTDEVKGTVYADTERVDKAFKVATMMLQKGLITADDMRTKVEELQQYRVSQIDDFARAIEKTASQGYANSGLVSNASVGSTEALVIGENISQMSNSGNLDDLKTRLTAAFTGGKV